MCSGMIWAISVPMQTAILGHLSADAIAANSVSSTFFQYLKVIVIAISSASAVVIGKDIGEGDIERVKSDGRTLSVIDLLIGVVLASLLFVLRGPLLSMYKLTDTAAVLADHFIMIMSIVMVWNVISDAGIGRCHSRWGRYKVLHVYESDLYMGDCDAVVIFGGIRVETPCGTGRVCSAVGSVVQRNSGNFYDLGAISGFTN